MRVYAVSTAFNSSSAVWQMKEPGKSGSQEPRTQVVPGKGCFGRVCYVGLIKPAETSRSTKGVIRYGKQSSRFGSGKKNIPGQSRTPLHSKLAPDFSELWLRYRTDLEFKRLRHLVVQTGRYLHRAGFLHCHTAPSGNSHSKYSALPSLRFDSRKATAQACVSHNAQECIVRVHCKGVAG